MKRVPQSGVCSPKNEIEKCFSLFLQKINDIILMCEVSSESIGKILEVNDRACRVLGYSREELLSMSAADIEVAENKKDMSKLLKELRETGQIVFQTEILTRNGRRIPVEVSAILIAIKDHPAVTAIFRDTTERKQAEEEISSSKKFLDMIIQESPFAMWISDKEGTVIRVNPSLCDIVKIKKDEIIGKYNVFKDENLERQGVMPQIKAVFEKFRPARFMVAWKAEYAGDADFRSARDMHIDVSMFPIINTRGDLTHVICQWVDITDRMKAEEELRKQKEFVNDLLNISNDTVLVFEPETGRAIRWNDQFRRVSGYSDEEIASLKVPDAYLGKEDLIRAKKAVKNMIHEGKTVIELNLLTRDGRSLPFEYSASFLKDETGTPRWSISIGRDIAQRKEAEEELRKSEENFRLLAENAPDAIFIRTGPHFVYVNKAMLKLLGAESSDQLIGQPAMERFHPDCREGIQELIRLLDEKKEAVPVNEQKYIKLDGTVIDVAVSAVPFRYKNTDSALVFVRDITKRKQAEKAVKVSEARYRALIELAPEAIAVYDLDLDRFVECNKRAEQLFGCSREELLRVGPQEFYTKVQPDGLAPDVSFREHRERIARGENLYFERWLKNTRGEDVYCEVSLALLPGVDRKLVRTCYMDITERKRAEVELRESQRFSLATIDALSAHICVLDETGRIVKVNRAWRAFADANPNSHPQSDLCEGANYLKVCDAAVGPDAAQAAAFAAGLRAVMRSERDDFSMEYPCHSPDIQRWFIGRVTRFAGTGPVFVVVSHVNITERREAEEELRRSEMRRSLAIDAAQAGTWEWDMTTGKNIWSDEIWHLYGLEPHCCEPSYEAWWETIHPEDREQILQILGEKIQKAAEITMEWRVHRPRNGFRWLMSRGRPVCDESGRAIRYLGVVIDITARKEAENALKESEEKFRTVFENSAAAIALINPDTTIENVNEAYLRIGGYTRNKVIGRSWTRQVIPEDRERMMEYNRRRQSGEKTVPNQYELGFINGAGEKRFAWLSVAMIPTTGKLIASFVDITERKRAEAELKRSEAALAEAQRIAHMGSFEYISETGTTVWSEEEYRIYGLDPSGGSPEYAVMLEKYIHPDDRDLLHKTFMAAIQSKSVYDLDHRIIRPDGVVRWVYNRAYPYMDENGNLLRYVGTTMDITERKLAEEEIRELNAELEERVRQRTIELTAKTRELERINKVFVDRELRMRELKERIAELEKKENVRREA